jgi:HEAT repeat protein
VDGPAALVLVCVLAGGSWLALAAAILAGRLRTRNRAASAQDVVAADAGVPGDTRHGPWLGEAATRSLLERGLRSGESDNRVASIGALGRLAQDHEWAVDCLVEGLANWIETPARVAAHLDGLAPRVGERLVPLLGHPDDVVRFYAVRLLARYGALARRHVPALTRDPSPNVRAAALETLRETGSSEALRCALQLLDDDHALVRAHASRTACRISGVASARFIAPLLADMSWWVRDAAREALVAVGPDVAGLMLPLLDDDDPVRRTGAALVLQDVGAIDELMRSGDRPERLELILAAGGGRLRAAAAARALSGQRLGGWDDSWQVATAS